VVSLRVASSRAASASSCSGAPPSTSGRGGMRKRPTPAAAAPAAAVPCSSCAFARHRSLVAYAAASSVARPLRSACAARSMAACPLRPPAAAAHATVRHDSAHLCSDGHEPLGAAGAQVAVCACQVGKALAEVLHCIVSCATMPHASRLLDRPPGSTLCQAPLPRPVQAHRSCRRRRRGRAGAP